MLWSKVIFNVTWIFLHICFVIQGDYENDLAPQHTRNGTCVNDPLPVYLSVDIISFAIVPKEMYDSATNVIFQEMKKTICGFIC